MPFPHPNDGQDEYINASDDESYEGDDSKEIGAVRIGNGAKGCLISMMIPSHNHEAEVQDGTSDQNGEGLMEGQRNDHLEDRKTILKGQPIQWDELRHKQPKPKNRTTISNDPSNQSIDQGRPIPLPERNFLEKLGGRKKRFFNRLKKGSDKPLSTLPWGIFI